MPRRGSRQHEINAARRIRLRRSSILTSSSKKVSKTFIPPERHPAEKVSVATVELPSCCFSIVCGAACTHLRRDNRKPSRPRSSPSARITRNAIRAGLPHLSGVRAARPAQPKRTEQRGSAACLKPTRPEASAHLRCCRSSTELLQPSASNSSQTSATSPTARTWQANVQRRLRPPPA